MNDSLGLHFLYRTVAGRAVLKVLAAPKVSVAAGRFLSTSLSKPLIDYYIKKHDIDMSDIDIPQGGFASFNDFFTRKKKNFNVDNSNGRMISPSDGFLTCIPIREEVVFDIKHTKFFLKDLLKNNDLAAKFKDGVALVYRLTPANYHRYCYVADGRIVSRRRINGELHCVRPVATSTIPVFVQNSREYQVIDTEMFGTIVQMEIGALMVGKISNNPKYIDNSVVWAGDEKGYFEFGGSTIVILLQKDAVEFSDSIKKKIASKEEFAVKIGECIGM